jgi:uncharacterized protein
MSPKPEGSAGRAEAQARPGAGLAPSHRGAMHSGPTERAAVPSPCVDVCRMDPRTGWCEGCQRTIDEIAQWSSLDDAAKRAVWERLTQRRASPHALAGR